MAPAHTKSSPARSEASGIDPAGIHAAVARIHNAVHGGTLDVAAVDAALADLSALADGKSAATTDDMQTA